MSFTVLKIIAVGCAMAVLAGCAGETVPSGDVGDKSSISREDKVQYIKITAVEAKRIMDEGDVIILDVRTRSEYDQGHIENALLLPENEISSRAEELLPDKEAVILVYCRSGRRSEAASRELIAKGYTNVMDFGGIIDWPYEIVN